MISTLFEPATAAWIAKDCAIAMGALMVVLAIQGIRRRAREKENSR